ncbi:RCC1 domain-containing protein [Pyxidicoccus sp. 3LG]
MLSWGDNTSGQLGDGTTTQRNAPVSVSNLTDVTAIAAGHGHALALRAGGTLLAWGNNAYGQLGDLSVTNRTVPVQVLTAVKSMDASAQHSLAVRTDGSLWAWGDNGFGQLGTGNQTESFFPIQVTGVTGLASVTAGAHHSMAVGSDGSLWSWGLNTSGQLGDGTTPLWRLSPAQVTALTGVVMASAGEEQSVAYLQDGTVHVWGGNGSGQLGLGDYASRLTPVQVTGL